MSKEEIKKEFANVMYEILKKEKFECYPFEKDSLFEDADSRLKNACLRMGSKLSERGSK